MKRPAFLTLDEVLALQADQIRRHGGRAGLRDLALLSSAIATPGVTFRGAYLHATVFEMAAAYLFHIARNHPFLDGNKRVSLMAALAFLWLNGLRVVADHVELGDLVLGVAQGRVSKAEVAVFLKDHARAKSSKRSRSRDDSTSS